MKKILFVGLGRMGSPMAGHLSSNHQFEVTVNNRSQEKISRWLELYQGKQQSTDQKQFDVIVLCIGNDEDVRSQLIGEKNLFGCLVSGGVVIDHTTTSVNLAKAMSQAAEERGCHYLDAPVSGGEAGAINGQLSCMVGGDEKALEKVRSVLQCYCKAVTYIGGTGAGQLTKMANQLAVIGTLSGLSEAVKLLQHETIDIDQVFQTIKGGAAQSWQMDNRFQTMVRGEFDFGFAVDHMIKDLTYVLQHAQGQGWSPDISSILLERYQSLSEAGYGQCDTSSLVQFKE